jgi:hypothetical protein
LAFMIFHHIQRILPSVGHENGFRNCFDLLGNIPAGSPCCLCVSLSTCGEVKLNIGNVKISLKFIL